MDERFFIRRGELGRILAGRGEHLGQERVTRRADGPVVGSGLKRRKGRQGAISVRIRRRQREAVAHSEIDLTRRRGGSVIGCEFVGGEMDGGGGTDGGLSGRKIWGSAVRVGGLCQHIFFRVAETPTAARVAIHDPFSPDVQSLELR